MFVVNAVGSTVGAATNLIPGVKQLKKMALGSDQLAGDPTLEDMILYTAVDKANLSVKSTPAKNLVSTAALSVRAGPLMKKNEQGKWHQVQACLVPHWFLYYYDTDKEDEPKGIIDLHLYTNTHIDDHGKQEAGKKKSSAAERTQHVLTLTTDAISVPDHKGNPVVNARLRPFYFASENKEEILGWTAAMNRDRYSVIRDERDAYQNLQDSFGGEMADLHVALAEQETQRNEIATKAAMAQLALDDCRQAMQQVLLTLGSGSDTETSASISDDSAGRSVAAFSERALRAIREMRDARQQEINSLNASHQQSIDEYNTRLHQLEVQAQNVQQDHAHALEAQAILHSEQIESLQQDMRNAHAATEQTHSELAVAAATARSATEKAAELNKVKNALVKECKTQRKRVEELESEAAARAAEKDSLTVALQKISQQKESLLQRIAAYDAEGSGPHESHNTTVTPASLGAAPAAPVVMPAAVTEASSSSSAPSPEGTSPASSASSSRESNSNRSQRAAALTQEIRAIRRLSGHASAAALPDIGENADDDANWKRDLSDENDTQKWAMTPAQLSELGWLSTEQQTALRSKNASEPRRSSPPKDASVLERALAVSLASLEVFSKGTGGGGGGGGASPPSNRATNSASLNSSGASSSDASSKPSARRSSMQMLSSFLTYDPNKPKQQQQTQKPLVEQEDDLLGLSPEKTPAPASAIQTSPEKDANVLRCLRCSGTVEGPMHSTCKCKQPQLEKKADAASSVLGGLGSAWNTARRASVNMTAAWGANSGSGGQKNGDNKKEG